MIKWKLNEDTRRRVFRMRRYLPKAFVHCAHKTLERLGSETKAASSSRIEQRDQVFLSSRGLVFFDPAINILERLSPS